MNPLVEPDTESLLIFPNAADEAYARAQEFRRLSPEERWAQILELMGIGLTMVHNSPRRAEIERRMEAEEAEWWRLQQELFRQHDA
ncbi:hypothetical protein BH10PLA2_BH10PLA2_29850 [soil metagenome]